MLTAAQKPRVVLILLCLIGLLGARQQTAGGGRQTHQSANETSSVPGWVVVQRDASGDDTQVIQAAIDQVDSPRFDYVTAARRAAERGEPVWR